jgi:hypothetical protein
LWRYLPPLLRRTPLSPRPSPLRFAVTVVAALATGAALAGVVSTVLRSNTDDVAALQLLPQFAFLAFGVIAGTLTLLVLSFRAGTSFPTRVKTCASCGSAVLENWRLCPDCGRFIEPGSETGCASRPDSTSTVRDSALPN